MTKLFFFIFIANIFIIFYLLHLIKSQQIKIEYSIIWIISLILLFSLSFSVKLLNKIANLLGIYYPPSLIIIIVFLLGIFILLNLTKTITKISDNNKINMQNIALSKVKNFKKNSEVLIIIPVFNEENNIKEIIEFLKENYKYDLVVINDCSTDNTKLILDNLNCNYIDLPYNSGYGIALETGYKFSARYNYKYTIQIDGDGQHEPADISKLVKEISNSDNDVIIGSRFLSTKSTYNSSFGRKFGIKTMRLILNFISNKRITDPTSGYQILNSKVINFFTNKIRFPTEYPDADMLLLLHKNNFNYKEVPVRMYSNNNSKSMHNGILKNFKYSIQMLLSLFVISITNNK